MNGRRARARRQKRRAVRTERAVYVGEVVHTGRFFVMEGDLYEFTIPRGSLDDEEWRELKASEPSELERTFAQARAEAEAIKQGWFVDG